MTQWSIIGRGQRGWFAKAKGVTSSMAELDDYVQNAQEGCIVYDAIGVDPDVYARFLVRAPMLNLELGPDEKLPFQNRDTLAFMMRDLNRSDAALGAAALDGGSLDFVGVAEYVRLLREVPGMRFGRVQSKLIAWELPQVEQDTVARAHQEHRRRGFKTIDRY